MEKVVIDSGSQVSHAVIWLHGLGADGHDFESFSTQIPSLAKLPPTRFIFPHAPMRKITINGGVGMRAWYDFLAPDLSTMEDVAGMEATQKDLSLLIDEVMESGIPSSRVVLGGFSQGCAMSLLFGTQYERKLAGLVGLSGYLPLAQELSKKKNQANQETAIFLAHGMLDGVVPVVAGEFAAQALKMEGFSVDYHRYQIAHNVSDEEIADVAKFIAGCFSGN
jgi:phospholipase/carboxylesterase